MQMNSVANSGAQSASGTGASLVVANQPNKSSPPSNASCSGWSSVDNPGNKPVSAIQASDT